MAYQARIAAATGLQLSLAPGKDAKDQAHKLTAFAGSFIKGITLGCVGCRWVKDYFCFFLSSFFSLFFLFSLFFSLLPTLFPLGRGPFASLARGQPSPLAIVILVYTGIHPWFSFRVFPCSSVANASSFFLFIDAGVFEDRAVAMGKPHCNRSICTFRLWIMRFCYHCECGDPCLVFLPCFSVKFRG